MYGFFSVIDCLIPHHFSSIYVLFQPAAVGTALAKANRRLVYGGGFKGLMGAVANAVVSSGGKVTGVIPSAMVAGGGEGEKGGNARSTTANPAQVILGSNENTEWASTSAIRFLVIL